MVREDFDIELPDCVYNHYMDMAQRDSITVEVLVAKTAAERLKTAVAQMKEEHGL